MPATAGARTAGIAGDMTYAIMRPAVGFSSATGAIMLLIKFPK
jgi:hypothetical protein